LQQNGAHVATVAPYVYADAAADEAVHSLAQQLAEKRIDAVAFTSMQQVQRLFDVLGDAAASAALAKTVVAAVGPVVADSLSKRGVNVELTPQDSYFLKPLTRALEAKFGGKSG
jgi:uroporphyrinogen-III synthase